MGIPSCFYSLICNDRRQEFFHFDGLLEKTALESVYNSSLFMDYHAVPLQMIPNDNVWVENAAVCSFLLWILLPRG